MNDYLNLPERPEKPRTQGITSIHDVGVPLRELRGILEDYGDYLDIAKLGVGSAYLTHRLDEKIALYREFGVIVYFGGSLFEKFYLDASVEDYAKFLMDHRIDWLEVSSGTIALSLETRVEIVERLSDQFTVLAEVGTKESEQLMPPSRWAREIQTFLEAGCSYVIAEGRASGTAGLYRPNQELRQGLVAEILETCPSERIIFEAPKSTMQMFFINEVGPNVNLGNIAPSDLLLLETQRCGLRSETFFVNRAAPQGDLE
jgi:phosphosulfolactate synthase